jgi:hypothetical protein
MIRTLNIFLFPVGPVAVVIPYLSKYNRHFFWLGMIWWYLLPFAYFTTFNLLNVGLTWGAIPYAVAAGQYLMADAFLAILTIKLNITLSTGTLFGFHLAFTIWTSLWVGNIRFFNKWSGQLFPEPFFVGLVRPHFEWAVVLAALATLLYLVALQQGHKVVFSKTLGGPGIEPMSLTLYSSEPEYNAITDEGRIQLT